MATATILLPVPAHAADPTNPPGFGVVSGSNRPFMVFDGTTDELCLWTFRMPADFGGQLDIVVQYAMASATTNVVAIRTEFQVVAIGEDIDTDSFSAVEASADDTVPGTAGNMGEIRERIGTPTINPNEYVALRFGRENGTTGTNATGDMWVFAVSLEYQTS